MSHGYRFKRMDEFRPGLGKKKFAFLRFDVHYRDLPGLYGFIDVNLALGVPANYYIQWDYSEVEFAARDDFLQLLKLEDENSRIGLHASPVDSWMIWDRFDGSEKRQNRFLDSAEGDEFITSLKEPVKFPQLFVLRPGTFDDAPRFAPFGDIWTASAQSWVAFTEGPKFAGQPDSPLALIEAWQSLEAK